MPFCHSANCDNPKEGTSNFCASCNREARKAARLASLEPKKRKPIKKVADKRAKQLTQYSRLKAQYIAIHQICECLGCFKPSVDIHHMVGRENEMLLDVNYFKAVCRDCHTTIELNPNWSKANGYSFDRLTTEI